MGVMASAGPQHSAMSLQTVEVPSICCAAPQGLNLQKNPSLSEPLPPLPLQQWGFPVGEAKGAPSGMLIWLVLVPAAGA